MLQYLGFAWVPAGSALIHATDSAEKYWTYSAKLFGYFVSANSNFRSSIGCADLAALHFEAGCNYENFDSGPIIPGRRFDTEKTSA